MIKAYPIYNTVYIEYDVNSDEFKEAYESYTSCIDRNASEDDMIRHTVATVIARGSESMVEGVGYVKVEGEEECRVPFSGITVSNNLGNIQFDTPFLVKE